MPSSSVVVQHIYVLSQRPCKTFDRVLMIISRFLKHTQNPVRLCTLTKSALDIQATAPRLRTKSFQAFPKPSIRRSFASMPELDANQGGDAKKKTYNKKATGEALKTAEAHSAEKDLKLYGSCFWYVFLSIYLLVLNIFLHIVSLYPRRICRGLTHQPSSPRCLIRY